MLIHRSILLCALLLSTFAMGQDQIGQIPPKHIVGGENTTLDEFPFVVSITKVYPPPRHQGNSPILGDIIISSLSGFVGFGWENFSQPVSSLEV